MKDSDNSSCSDEQDDYERLSDNDAKPNKKALAKKRNKQKQKPNGRKGRRVRKIRRNPAACLGNPNSDKPCLLYTSDAADE